MLRSFSSPGRYIQGKGAIKVLGKEMKPLGKRILVLCSKRTYREEGGRIKEIFQKENMEAVFEEFHGEITQEEAERVCRRVEEMEAEAVAGIGGGKILDTAKYAAELAGRPAVVVPTSAASDAPCSAVSVIYSQEGEFEGIRNLKENPRLVLVDTEIVIKAPRSLLVAGIGDAFATYYEARACREAGAKNNAGYAGTASAYALAEICRDILLEKAEEALCDYEKGQVTPAFEQLVEANIYLSGIGFESNGCALAHGVYNGMTSVIRPFPAYHGAGVAYGTLIQLLLEQIPEEEWEAVLNFYKKTGLPVKLADLGIRTGGKMLWEKLARAVCQPDSLAENMPFSVTPEMLYEAVERLENM